MYYVFGCWIQTHVYIVTTKFCPKVFNIQYSVLYLHNNRINAADS